MLVKVMWGMFLASFAVRVWVASLQPAISTLMLSVLADGLFGVPVVYWLFTVVRGWRRRRENREIL